MGDTNLSNLTASLEELSLKKQLPLRQTTQKPVLKYNQQITRPNQYYNQQKVIAIGPDGNSAYSNLNQAALTSPMVPTPFRVSRHPNPAPVPFNKTGGQTYISPNNVGKPPISQAAKPHANPYNRPLSAKDIVSDLLNQNHQKMVKTFGSTPNSGVPASSSILGSASSASSSNSGGSTFPVNSFMRPQSAVRKETKVIQKDIIPPKEIGTLQREAHIVQREVFVAQKEAQKESSSSSNSTKDQNVKVSNTDSVKKAVKQNTDEKDSEPARPKSAALSQKTVTQQGDQVITRQGQNGVTVIQKVAAPPNFGTQINTIISKVTESSKVEPSQASSVSKSTTLKHSSSTSSLPRPGMTGNNNNTKESPSKIRNLNYTPTKPYEEVKDPNPTPKSIKEEEKKSKQQPATLETPISEKKPPKQETWAQQLKQPVSSTVPIQGRDGTSYYRKGSKSEVMVHEQRPPVLGAPARNQKILDKVDVEDDAEEDEEEEEGSTPGERQPGDGEASLDGDVDDDDDDDGIDNLDDDCIEGSDGESDGYSITSSLSRRSSSSRSRAKSASTTRPVVAARPISTPSDDEIRPRTVRPATAIPAKPTIRPPLTQSLFPNIPPTISFETEGFKVEQLPWDLRKLLKWRMSPITPNIVKHTLARSHFRITKRNHDWLGCWGKHMKSQGFKSVREYQKLNHFPGSFQIGRKDRLWRNLSKLQVQNGKKEFGFFPQTFILPSDMKLLKRAWEDGGTKQKWIVKPPASARGIGIKVINKWTQIPRKRPVIVQKYLGRPYLINDSKFDMRIYVYVSSYDPLRIYIFEDGLARFASMKYSTAMKNVNNKFMHLTNYSVNKKNAEYQANGDEALCQGHKWGLKALWNYMKRQGINTTQVWENIKDLVIKTIICAESPINSMIKSNCRSRYCVHELFGFDVLLDENLKPWILEVNISPSLHSNSQLDINIKGQMIRDLMNIAGFRIPDKADVLHSNSVAPSATEFSSYMPPNDMCMDKRLFTSILAPDERAKHAYYCQRHQDEQTLQTILDILTPDDVRILTECIDEDSRKGCFQRVFPTPSSHKYLRYMEAPRYYNLLVSQWVQRFNRMEQKGIAVLEGFCEEGIHLQNPTEDPSHQWCPPNGLLSHRGDTRTHSAPNKHHLEKESSLKHSQSTSGLPKMAKKPPKAPSHGHSGATTRTVSQCSSASSSITSLTSPTPTQTVNKTAASSR
ncbi:tubulin monoglutamylase TTLL4-like [Saccostrea cucullata]|uniref:tubulin monoglutamylase TTLL4-like n=1 Tax=Saccostrea cuccullata TaxID=36930 RepID=UPI002ED04447